MSTVVKSQNYTVQEVADLLGCSKSHAYKLVRQINKDLKEKNFSNGFTIKEMYFYQER